ncbi:FecR family protein [Bryobacter aggregatus]|uniref:FecR family protein n=1 Tax=Bryobacter aggregatus TaxID=360054 RepID=UPI0004E1E07F|nr:FecR family protein [Bryobacter aggregatus]
MLRTGLQSALWTVALTLVCGVVSSAQMLPIAPGSTGKVLHVQGQVQVLRDEIPWAINVGDTINPKQEIITGFDGYAKIQVPDGSVFEIFPGSRATFRSNQGNLRELLDLWIGRVKVHIEKLNGKPNPNRIQTPSAVISVRGTTFDVTVEDGDETLVLVEEGQVAVQHALMPFSSAKILNGGDYLRVYKNQPIADKSFDRGQVLLKVLRMMQDIWITQPHVGGAAGPGAGPSSVPGGLPGDTGAPPPPPSAPPPPPGV